MAGHNDIEEIDLTDVILRDPNDRSKMIAQLMQQIADMRAEMQRNLNLTNLAIAANVPHLNTRRPPLHFPSLSSPIPEHFLFPIVPTTSAPKTTIIDLTTTDPDTTYQTPNQYTSTYRTPNQYTPYHLLPKFSSHPPYAINFFPKPTYCPQSTKSSKFHHPKSYRYQQFLCSTSNHFPSAYNS
ncbi:hypothetical protein HAX54_015498 [Datura stramonium]|uniref:Uncharacterized protein n=1 Tax=Datura stramonium TaxID=4076 RepID=A0ABS8TRN5_DATST|nr:hypothetical protein [Datura stramonium]